MLKKKTASPTVAVNVFDHAYQNNEKPVSGYITNAYVTNIFTNVDHRPLDILALDKINLKNI